MSHQLTTSKFSAMTVLLPFPRDWAELLKKEQMETAANRWVLERIQATVLAVAWELVMGRAH